MTANVAPHGNATMFGRSRLSTGIVGRELRAALPLALTLSLIPSLLPVVLWRLGSAFSGNKFGMPEADALRAFWIFASVLMAFLLGVLCGAEEEENRTLEFALVQPVHPLRVLAEKIAGSVLAFLLWAAGSAFLCMGTAWLAGNGFTQMLPLRATDGTALPPWWLAAFFVPLGVGAWARRVMVSALASSLIAIVCFCVVSDISTRWRATPPGWLPGFFALTFALLGLLAAVVRYRTRGMGKVALWRSRDFDVSWKDRRERRTLLIGLALAVCAGPVVAKRMPYLLASSDFPGVQVFCLLAPLWFASVVLGGTYYSKCEQEPAESFLGSLPISPRGLWLGKMRALFAPWLALALLAAVLMFVYFAFAGNPYERFGGMTYGFGFRVRGHDDFAAALLAYGWLLSFPLLFFSIATGLHIRSTIVRLAVTPLLFLGVIAITVATAAARWTGRGLAGWQWPLLLAVALALWVRFATGRTPLRELAGWQRFLLLLLFAAAVTEIYGLVVLCDWRDLAFLVLGV